MISPRVEPAEGSSAKARAGFKKHLNKLYGCYAAGFVVFVLAMAAFEQMGLTRQWIGFAFLFAPIVLYGGIGVMSRTADATEYYVAGRRVQRCTTAWPPARTG